MNTAVINIKTEPEIKIKAQTIAKELGLNLSSVINAYLVQLIRTKTVIFSTTEEPTNYLLKMIANSQKEIKAAKITRKFKKTEDALGYLDKMIEDEKNQQN
jgi:addiction module RelB/DinJ family antitoxin